MPGVKIVIEGVAQGRLDQVVPAMARVFYVAEPLARQILGAAPCVILDGLTERQALGIQHALFPLHQAGANIQISNAPDGALAKINWPEPPRVNGRLLSAFDAPPAAGEGVAFACPCCGAKLTVAQAAGEPAEASPAAAAPQPAPVSSDRTVRSTGGPGKLSEIPTPRRLLNPVGPRPATAASPAPPAPPAGPARSPTDKSKSRSSGALPARPPAGPDELVPLGEKTAAELPKNPSGALPEVPRLEASTKPHDFELNLESSGTALNRSGPMALEDFEAGLAVDMGPDPFAESDPLAELEAGLPNLGDAAGGKKDLLAELDEIPEPKLRVDSAEPSTPARPATPAKPATPARRPSPPRSRRPSTGKRARISSTVNLAARSYSVFVNKTKNPRMVPLLAEVMGVTIDQAKRIARKSIIPVAKNVDKSQAEEIRERFAAANIAARVTAKS